MLSLYGARHTPNTHPHLHTYTHLHGNEVQVVDVHRNEVHGNYSASSWLTAQSKPVWPALYPTELGVGWRSPQGKWILLPLPWALPQPGLWGYFFITSYLADVHLRSQWRLPSQPANRVRIQQVLIPLIQFPPGPELPPAQKCPSMPPFRYLAWGPDLVLNSCKYGLWHICNSWSWHRETHASKRRHLDWAVNWIKAAKLHLFMFLQSHYDPIQ